MKLKFDSKKPRRVEIVVFQDDEFDVSDRIGDQLRTITGFVPVDEAEAASAKSSKKRGWGTS